mmetsp:Transcript_50139/g.92562  ORF Transcript_50139/g.92562 Transcript_50139/m.92562 type:complete len:263 (-) Transcript_50139:198-986(-)
MLTTAAQTPVDEQSRGEKACFRLGEEIPEAYKRTVKREVFALGEVVPVRRAHSNAPRAPVTDLLQSRKAALPERETVSAEEVFRGSPTRSTSSLTFSAPLRRYTRPAKQKSLRRIVFLDVDGVLHAAHNAHSSFSPRCMRSLAEIVNTAKAEIVLSSSWRLWAKGVGRAAVDAALVKYGMAKTIGETPTIGEGPFNSGCPGMRGRAAEIRRWLQLEAGAHVRWVVLDDMDMNDELGSHMILTDPLVGLQQQNVQDAIAELMR